MGFGDNMEITAANEDTVSAIVRIQPEGEVESGFNEEKLTVGVPNADREIGELPRNFKKEEYYEPFVFQVIAVPELAVEMGDLVGGGGRECEGLVLPDIVGGVRRKKLEDFEVERLKLSGGAMVWGLGGNGEVREDREEYGVVLYSRGALLRKN